MHRAKLMQDIQPLSSVRANLSTYIEQVKKTKRPLIVTQNGKSTAILMDVEIYEDLLDKMELMEELQKASKEAKTDKVTEHQSLMKELKSRIKVK